MSLNQFTVISQVDSALCSEEHQLLQRQTIYIRKECIQGAYNHDNGPFMIVTAYTYANKKENREDC